MASEKQRFDALLEMMKAPDEEIQNATGIIYGDSGGGKTVLAARLAQEIARLYNGTILHLDAVNAWRSLKNHPELMLDERGNKNFIRVKYKGKAQLDTLVSALNQRAPGYENIKVVILDEMSAMADFDLDLVLKVRAEDDKDKDPDTPTQPDMGASTHRMRRTVMDLLKVEGISVIFVSHQRNDVDKDVGFATIRPRFMPKFSGTIREGLDFVVHMSAKPLNRTGDQQTYERMVQCHPTTTVVAKSRVGGLGLKVSPDDFVEGVLKWLKGETGNSTRDIVVNDKYVDVSEASGDDDFGGISVD